MGIPTHLHQQAASEYLENIYEFVGQVGYGRVMTGRQINYAKSSFLSVDDWYCSLNTAGQKRIIDYLQYSAR